MGQGQRKRGEQGYAWKRYYKTYEKFQAAQGQRLISSEGLCTEQRSSKEKE